jgi:hypothetical protein
MKDHNGVLMMQRMLLAGTLGMAMARKAAAILEGAPSRQGEPGEPCRPAPAATAPDGTPQDGPSPQDQGSEDGRDSSGFREPRGPEGAVLRAILDAANECLGHFDDRPAGERWCDTLFHLLDLAAFAAELSGRS